ncbi:hypothetical protein T12_8767 [Trichinella patagoniensis]|uniref:Uncharacterized protein n=1 Tax=Trichinella patagoniensis TaxID=990121 RepID=A0A0V1AHB1_9BILA|nr:hypothetical protein T12_8767 [Trichinella patagoniensis]
MCKNRGRVLYACDAQMLLRQPNAGSQEGGSVGQIHTTNVGPNNSTRTLWLLNDSEFDKLRQLLRMLVSRRAFVARYIERGPAAPAGGSLGPPMGGSLTAAAMLSAPLISRWSFGVLVHLAASSKRRDNDAASGARVLFFLRSRPLCTIGAGGVTPTGSVTFRTEHVGFYTLPPPDGQMSINSSPLAPSGVILLWGIL